MRAAIATDGEFVSAHFGRCAAYTLADIEDGRITNRKQVTNPGHAPGAIPQFLHGLGVERIVCGGMGFRAAELFAQMGIQTTAGVSGTVEETLAAAVRGTLDGGESLCQPGAGRGFGIEKTECGHAHEQDNDHGSRR